MPSIQISSATTAPPIIFQAERVRRRIAASDSVAAVLAALAYGDSRRSDLTAQASLTAARVADAMGAQ